MTTKVFCNRCGVEWVSKPLLPIASRWTTYGAWCDVDPGFNCNMLVTMHLCPDCRVKYDEMRARFLAEGECSDTGMCDRCAYHRQTVLTSNPPIIAYDCSRGLKCEDENGHCKRWMNEKAVEAIKRGFSAEYPAVHNEPYHINKEGKE